MKKCGKEVGVWGKQGEWGEVWRCGEVWGEVWESVWGECGCGSVLEYWEVKGDMGGAEGRVVGGVAKCGKCVGVWVEVRGVGRI